jgi:hypothetical protein
MTEQGDNRSLGQLFSEVSQGVSKMFRQEVELAKAEFSVKIKKALKSVIFIALGGAMLYAGFLGLVAAAILGLWAVLPLWLSALLIGLAVIAIGGFLAIKGIMDLKENDIKPRKTIETVKEGIEWAKKRV